MAMVSSKLVFSRRRTLALEIDRDGQLIVRAPYGTPKIYIDRFVAEKRNGLRRTPRGCAAAALATEPLL